MAEKIKLVQGDNRPYITLKLKDADGVAINLTGAAVKIYFRKVGTETILTTLNCTLIDSGVYGEVVFNFPGTTLNVEAGMYEGEVEITFGNEVQTVYDVLKFQVRSQFN